WIKLPTGFPPRTTLGYGSTILLHVLDQFALIDFTAEEEMAEVSEFLTSEQDAIKAESKALAAALKGKTVVACIEDRIESVAL
ncbi:hypothetical protein ACSTJP_00365, partial [Vibrio parahaemolyticus]